MPHLNLMSDDHHDLILKLTDTMVEAVHAELGVVMDWVKLHDAIVAALEEFEASDNLYTEPE